MDKVHGKVPPPLPSGLPARDKQVACDASNQSGGLAAQSMAGGAGSAIAKANSAVAARAGFGGQRKLGRDKASARAAILTRIVRTPVGSLWQ